MSGRWRLWIGFLLAALVGCAAGLAAYGFHFMTQWVQAHALVGAAGHAPSEAAQELQLFDALPTRDLALGVLVGVMGLGGLIVGLLVWWAPDAEGPGTGAAIEAFHHKGGRIDGRVVPIKLLASAVTVGTGGSGGREGPIAQIGAGVGSWLATQLGLSTRDRRIMLAAGMAAGIGAMFRAPLAGALYAAEILYSDSDIESDVIVPATISSVAAYSVYSLFLPAKLRFTPLFGATLDFRMESLAELLPLALLALVLALGARLFVHSLTVGRAAFERLPVWRPLKPAIGMTLAGLVAVALYVGLGRRGDLLAVLAAGYGAVQSAIDHPARMGAELLLVIALGKILTTSLTICSGGSAGVFGPSIVIGGCLGGAIGLIFADWWPGLVPDPATYVIFGMAGFFAGSARAPISTIVMVLEMTGGYYLLVSSMWVTLLCFAMSRGLRLYSGQVRSRLESPAHRGEFLVDVLEGITVADAYDPARELRTVPVGTTLDGIVHLLAEVPQRYFPVVDADGRMVGIFSSSDVRAYLYDETIWQLTIAGDVMTSQFLSVTPDDDLAEAMQRFTRRNLDELPVVDPEDPGKLLGMLRRKEAIALYNRRVLERKQEAEAED